MKLNIQFAARAGFVGLAVFFLVIPACGRADELPAWHPGKAPLMTRWAADVSPTNVLPEYPRPQLVRPDWLNLNGLWDYAVTPDSASMPRNASFALSKNTLKTS